MLNENYFPMGKQDNPVPSLELMIETLDECSEVVGVQNNEVVYKNDFITRLKLKLLQNGVETDKEQPKYKPRPEKCNYFIKEGRFKGKKWCEVYKGKCKCK